MRWHIETWAGTGIPGYHGDGEPAEQARLNWPRDVAVDASGALYIADTLNHRIRRVGPDGVITTVAGVGQCGHSGDGGPAIGARLAAPRGVAVAPDGSVYVSDTENHCVRRITPDGIIHTVAGTCQAGDGGDDGPAVRAQLSWPAGIAIAPDGSVYVADSGNDRIRRLHLDGSISTVAGTGRAAWEGDGGPAVAASLSCPRGVTVGPDGTLWIGDTENHRVRRISPEGFIHTAAGTGEPGYAGDNGPAAAARLRGPRGLAAAPDGSLFIADCDNSVIRLLTPAGLIIAIAGTGKEGCSGDGGPALAARLADPHGIALAPGGSLYLAEPRSSRVRVLRPAR